MKYKGQGKKNYIVIKFDDFTASWRAFSKPVTINQAVWLVQDAPSLKLDVVNLKYWQANQ